MDVAPTSREAHKAIHAGRTGNTDRRRHDIAA